MSEIQELEAQIEQMKDFIDKGEAARKLFDNPEFKKIFMEDYFVHEAARLVQLSGDPALTAEQRADALAMAQATGHTKRYLSVLVQMSNTARQNVRDMESTLEELRAEEH